MTANRDVKLYITFSREGRTDYEGTARWVILKADKPLTVIQPAAFKENHHKLKFQISRVDPGGSSEVDLTFENVWLTESVDSVVARYPLSELTKERAASAFAEGYDGFALAIRLWLAHLGERDKHDAEIVQAAANLGMSDDLIDPDRLLEVLALTPLTPPAPETPQPVVSPVAAVAAPEDNLDRLGRAVLDSVDDTGHAASLLLRSCATALLLDPQKTLLRLTGGSPLADAVARAQKALPEAAPLRQHYERVLSHARSRSGASAA